MKNLLSDLRKEFDYVLIDSPAGIDGGFKLATADSDRIIVVTTPQIAAIHDADCVIQLLHRKKVPRIDLLVNGYRRQMVTATCSIFRISVSFWKRSFWVLFWKTRRLSSARTTGNR